MSVGPVVANNTPLVALWSIGRLDLLQALFDEVLIPQAVWAEFIATESIARQTALDISPWIIVISLADPNRVRTYVGLDRGEIEVLALAEERSARLVIIDELKGRRYAKHLGIPLTGTLGVLLLAKERGLIEAIGPLLQELQSMGLYLAQDLVIRTLELAGEM